MKKKILAALVCAAMVMSLAGCAANEDEEPTSKRDKPKKDESSYSENSGNPGGGSDTTSTSDINSDNSSAGNNGESGTNSNNSNTSSNSGDNPSVPAAEKIDWSKVPVVDEMDLDYTIYSADDINMNYYAAWIRDEVKEMVSDGCVLITKYFGDAEYINLPDQIEGKSCILIKDGTVWGKNAKAIKFSEGCAPLDALALKTGNRYILNAGYGSNITEAVVPDGWRYIGGFSVMSNLETINIPKETRRIWGSAFSFCTQLKSVTIPENIEYIYSGAFEDCTGLETITFPKKLEGEAVLGEGCFYGCTSLKTVELPEGCVPQTDRYGDITGTDLFGGCTSLEKASVPTSMKYVVAGMFSGCTALTEVKLADGIERIDRSAFYKCTSLKSIDIPDSVTMIESDAFSGCKDIEINFKGKTYNEKNIEKIYGKDLSTM